MKRFLALLCAPVVAVPLALGLSAAPASAANPEPNQPCGTTERIVDDTDVWQYMGSYTSDFANLRTGTSSQCSITGRLDKGEWVQLHCYVVDAIGRYWDYLHTSGGEYGWALETVVAAGAHSHCPR